MAFGKGLSIPSIKIPSVAPVAVPSAPGGMFGGGMITSTGFSAGHDAGMGGGIADAERGMGIGKKQWQGGKPWGKKKL